MRSVLRALAAAVVGALVLAPTGAGAADEPFSAQQWGLRQIGAPQAWTVSRGAGARIGVIDTGVDLAHEDLPAGTVVDSTRCIGTGGRADRCAGSAQDDNGHGTHVAGTLAAPRNGKGIAGVAPEAQLLVVKALDGEGGGDAVDVAAGIDWLVARGAGIVNLSLADASAVGQVLGTPIETAIRRSFRERGVVFVLAGGNREEDGSEGDAPEGGYGDLPALVVAATGPEGRPARYNVPLGSARWGLAAPGGDGSTSKPEREIVSSYWYGQQRNAYAWSEGTSMAAPHVAGVAALLWSQGLRGQAVVDRILGTLRPLDCGPGCRGALDARAALGAAAEVAATTTTTVRGRVGPVAPRPTGSTASPPTTTDVPVPDAPGEATPATVALLPSPVALPVAQDLPATTLEPPLPRPTAAATVAALLLGAVTAAALRSVRQTRVRRTVTTFP